MPKKKSKFIRVTEETHRELTEMGKKGETYDDIIQRLIKNAQKWSQCKEKVYWILHRRIPPLTEDGIREIIKELSEG
ncbi:MAG: hypothetical protein ACE5OW_05690 [Candidatus Bathyarchaeia archaeon]